MKVQIESEFSTVGLNPTSNCLDCRREEGGDGDVLTFGAGNSVVVCWTRTGKEVVSPQCGARVNCTKFVTTAGRGGEEAILVMSGTTSGRVMIHRVTGEALEVERDVLVGGRGGGSSSGEMSRSRSILCVTSCPKCGGMETAIDASGRCFVWKDAESMSGKKKEQQQQAEAAAPTSVQEIRGKGLLEACAVCEVDSSGGRGPVHLLAIAGVENKVRVFSSEGGRAEMKEVVVLCGHQDWIRSLAFSPPLCGDVDVRGGGGGGCCCGEGGEGGRGVLLASGSQDTKVRIWRIVGVNPREGGEEEKEKKKEGKGEEGAAAAVMMTKWRGTVDAVLGGHDDWVTGVEWIGRRRLVTGSMDRTVAVWEPDEASGVWMSAVRVWGVPGNVLGGSVFGFRSIAVSGGGGGGGEGGGRIYGHGFTGAIHCWDISTASASATTSSAAAAAAAAAAATTATPKFGITTGHVGRVTAVAWSSAEGDEPAYLVSGSEDRTVRIFAQEGGGGGRGRGRGRRKWVEIARPVVHGHGINGMCIVGCGHRMAMTSSEKAVRVYEAPSTFVRSLFKLAGREMSEEQRAEAERRPLGAVLPPLSLSNRPIFEEEKGGGGGGTGVGHEEQGQVPAEVGAGGGGGEEEEGEGEEGGGETEAPSKPAVLTSAPLEEHLTHNTLWPESAKLYAHAAEASCVSGTRRRGVGEEGQAIVSGSTALRAGEATVCVWRPGRAQPVAVLGGHRGSVSTVSVSPDGTQAASTSIDMSLIIWTATAAAAATTAAPTTTTTTRRRGGLEGEGEWGIAGRLEHAFRKVPVGSSWSPEHDVVAIAGGEETGVSLFRVTRAEGTEVVCFPCGRVAESNASTSVCWAPATVEDGGGRRLLLLAVGQTNGNIAIISVAEPTLATTLSTMTIVPTIPREVRHEGAVTALDWRIDEQEEGDYGDGDVPADHSTCRRRRRQQQHRIATGGADHFVKVMKLTFMK